MPASELFTGTELLGRMAMERMLEPVGEQVEADATSISKSAVLRKFVAMTETALADLLAADLSGLDLVAIMIDGVHVADHLCVVALGIGIDGVKHPLAVRAALASIGLRPTPSRAMYQPTTTRLLP